MKYLKKYNESSDYLDYNKVIDFFEGMKTPVNRFNDVGFYLHDFRVGLNTEVDFYSCYGVDYYFESFQ